MSNQEPPRDEKGDVIITRLTNEQEEHLKVWQQTYVFTEWFQDKEWNNYLPVYDKYDEKNFRAFPDLKIKFHQIFITPENPWDGFFERKNKYELLLNTYFTEVLAIYPREKRFGLKFEKTRFYLSEETYNKIDLLITDFNLQEHSDFIFFLIASIQEKYIDEILDNEKPEEANRIRKYPNEVKTLISALELTERDKDWDFEKDGLPPQLEKVIFKFKNHKYNKPLSYIINDQYLCSLITDSFKDKWGNASLKDWKKQLEHFPKTYTEYEKNNQYKYSASKALHKFFINEGIFKLKGKKTTNEKAILCIARILELSHIYPKTNDQEIISSYDAPKDVINIVRNWIKRKEIIPKEKSYELEFDKELLSKYFDKELLECINNHYEAFQLDEAATICVRYKIDNLFPYISQLLKILNCKHLFLLVNSGRINSPEHLHFIQFFDSLKQSSNEISGFKILKKDSSEIEITSSSFLNIIERSLLEYYTNNTLDFKFDLYKIVDDKPVLKEPSERFLPQFCLSFFNFLKEEMIVPQTDIKPSETYYMIIGDVINQAGYFSNHYLPEWFYADQAMKWHEIALNK